MIRKGTLVECNKYGVTFVATVVRKTRTGWYTVKCESGDYVEVHESGVRLPKA